jgi:hypothetical protein
VLPTQLLRWPVSLNIPGSGQIIESNPCFWRQGLRTISLTCLFLHAGLLWLHKWALKTHPKVLTGVLHRRCRTLSHPWCFQWTSLQSSGNEDQIMFRAMWQGMADQMLVNVKLLTTVWEKPHQTIFILREKPQYWFRKTKPINVPPSFVPLRVYLCWILRQLLGMNPKY